VAKKSALSARFVALATQLEAVEATEKFERSEYFSGDRIDDELFLNWKVKAKNIIALACKRDSEHYRQFVESETPGGFKTNYDVMKDVKAVFFAAKKDFEGGYLNSFRSLVQADVFSDELDQATELLRTGYRLKSYRGNFIKD